MVSSTGGMFGVVFLILAGVAALFALLAVILGAAALVRISSSKGELRGRGLALGALVLGLVWLMFVPFLFLLLGFVGQRSTPTVRFNSSMSVPAPVSVQPAATPGTAEVNVEAESSDIVVPPDILEKAETGDVFETVPADAPKPAPAPVRESVKESVKVQEF